MATRLGSLDFAAGKGGGFKDPFVTHGGFLIRLSGSYPGGLLVTAHLLLLSVIQCLHGAGGRRAELS